jgi:hypothetical protein
MSASIRVHGTDQRCLCLLQGAIIEVLFGYRRFGDRAGAAGPDWKCEISRQRGKYLKEQEFRRPERNFSVGAGSAADTESRPARAGLSDVVNWHGELWNNELRQAADRA